MPKNVTVYGYARMPQGTPLYEMHKAIALGLLIDKGTDCILDIDATFISRLSRESIRLLIGHKITEKDNLIEIIESTYIGLGQRPLISALLDAQKRYLDFKKSSHF